MLPLGARDIPGPVLELDDGGQFLTCQQGLRLLCKTLRTLQSCRRWDGNDIESSGVEDVGSMLDPRIVKRGSPFL